MPKIILVGLLGLLFNSLPAMATDGPWPQWRGPQRDDVSEETGLLQAWPEDGPPHRWLFKECGLGYAGPAIVGDRLYILGARAGQEELICLDVNEGREVWSKPLGLVYENGWGDGPRSTPTVEGKFIYVLAARGNLACLQIDDGTIVWQRTMQDLGGQTPNWGYSESPLIHEEKILCTPGGEQGAVAALDKATGDLLWQTSSVDETAHYSSIVVTEQAGREIGVQLLVSQLIGFSLNDGKVLWSVPWGGSTAVVPTPIVWKNDVYVTSGYGAGCMLVRLHNDDTIEQIYDNNLMTNHHGGVIRLGNYLYGYSDGKGWVCQNFATGTKKWSERTALGKGAIAYADSRFYCISEDEGHVVLIDASEEGWHEQGRFTLDPQTELRKPRGKIWVHPVIANGRLYLRDQELLFCFDIRDY
ncbi:MAG: PQQ-binding-like beta-propeller repeat protein [Pirellulales bacterium]|nr:PQQ-binding-like beta-propeller repeat protein [Pirellulales bacterium]